MICPPLDHSAAHDERIAGGLLTASHMRWYWEQYLGPSGEGTHPYASPLQADLTGVAPAHIITAGHDPLWPEGMAFADRLRAAGVPVALDHYPETFHGFVGFTDILPAAKQAAERIFAALRNAFSATRSPR